MPIAIPVDRSAAPSVRAGRLGRGALMLACAAPFAALLVLRSPGLLVHAAFWGEDGWLWYPQAYRLGWSCLAIPWTGYLQTFSRLAALLACALPLAWAPTLFAAIGFATQVAAALFLLSTRLDRALPSLGARLGIALLYLLLPNSFELVGRLTDAQWHLALLAFLVLQAAPARGAATRGLDLAVLALSGLSGPMGLLLIPNALLAWRDRGWRDRGAARAVAMLVATGALQAALLLSPHSNRARVALGATPLRLARILAQQVVVGAELGRHAMGAVRALPAWRDGVLPVAVALAAAATCAAALRRGPPVLRRFALFAGLVLAGGLASPEVADGIPAWRQLVLPDIGDRYYVFAMLAWLGCVLRLAVSRGRAARLWGASLLGIALASLPGDYRFATPLAAAGPTDFVARARAFARAPAGTEMLFPVRPAGTAPMRLVRR